MSTLKKSLLVAAVFSLMYGISTLAVCSKYQEYVTKVTAAREKVKDIEASINRLNQMLEIGELDIYTRREVMHDRATRQAELQEVSQLEEKLRRCIEQGIN